MTSIDYLRELLHQLASFLVWPVLISLLSLFAFTLLSLGSFLKHAWKRRSSKSVRNSKTLSHLDQCALQYQHDPDLDLRLEEVLQGSDQEKLRSIGRLRMAVRLGPSLGLMGTLIPMADALQGLADGNLPRLASNMVTAFAATVIGLLISVLAYSISSAREAWAREDSRAAAFHAERLLRQASNLSTESSGHTVSNQGGAL